VAVKIFFCYAHEDEALLNKLRSYLKPLQRQGIIDMWYDRDISAGTEWEYEISKHLNEAQIILLLISPDFMYSDYCYSVEMQKALERHAQNEVTVIPIILRPIYWEGTLGNIQALPTDARPVVDRYWHNLDEAFFDVAEGIRKVAEEYNNRIYDAILAGKFQFSLSSVIDPIPNVEFSTPQYVKQKPLVIIPRGSRFILKYHVFNALDIEVTVWLGANLRVDEHYFFDVEEDIDVLLRSGHMTYTRFLKILDSWPTTYHYLLEAAVHYGVRSNPRNSIKIAPLWTDPTFFVID
jgi:TIR domain